MPKLTIDGKTIEVAEGATVLEAARANDIYIPTLCYHEAVNPIGSCRLCIVEVEGADHPMASCTTPAIEGMVVRTTGERLTELRRQALRFILLNHPLECPVCDKAGECRLQDLTYELGVTSHDFEGWETGMTVDRISPLIERSDPRCIRCGRCIAVCTEVQGVSAYRYSGRGYKTKVDTQDGGPLNCEFCGQCIHACPVGALTNRMFKYKARVWDLSKVPTVCAYCGAGCNLELHVRRNTVYRTYPCTDNEANRGNLCVRGTFGFDFVGRKDRLGAPLISQGGKQAPTEWDKALDFATAGLKEIIENHGPASVAVLGSGRLTNEEAYLLQKLARAGLKTPHVDTAAGYGLAEAVAVLHRQLDYPDRAASYDDLESSDAIFVLGSDLGVEMPVPALRVLRASRVLDASVVVAFSRRTKLHGFATTPITYIPGTLRVLMTALLAETAGGDGSGLAQGEGREQLVSRLAGVNAGEIAAACGVEPTVIAAAAATLRRADRPVFVLGAEALCGPDAAQIAGLAANLISASGKEGALLLSLDRNNALGAMDVGLSAGWLPGYAATDSASAELAKTYGTDLPADPGMSAPRILDACREGTIKAMLILGADPLRSFPEEPGLAQALGGLEFLLVADLFPTETANLAHCVLPAAGYAEKDGTFTSAEGRVQRIRRAVDTPKGTMPDWRILMELGKRLGMKMDYEGPRQIFAEIAGACPRYAGLDYPALEEQGVRAPVDGPGDFQTGGYTAPSEKALPGTGSGNGLLLVAGAELYHCGSLSTYATGPVTLSPGPYVGLTPADAGELGLAEGDKVRVSTDLGGLEAPVRLMDSLSRGTVFVPVHFGGFGALSLLGREQIRPVRVERA